MSAAVTAGSLAVLLSEQPGVDPGPGETTRDRDRQPTELRTKTGAGSGALD